MAGNNSDGSIVIDTELDNSGFEKGSKELLSAVKSLTNSFNNMGTMLSKVFEDSIIPALNTAADNTADILELMRRNNAMAAEAGQQVVSSEQQITQEAQRATQAIQQQADAAKNVSGSMANISASAKDVSAGTNAAGKSADAYQKQIDRTQAKIDTLKTKLVDYYTAADKIQNPPENEDWLRGVEDPEQIANALKVEEMAMESLNKKYAVQLNQLKTLETELARLKALQQEAANSPSAVADSAAVKSFASEVGKTESKLASYQAKVEKMQTMGANSSAWKNVQYDIDATKTKLDEYREKLEQLNASGGISAESYEKLSGTLAKLTETQGNLSALTASMTQTSAAGNRVNVFLGSFGTALKSAGRSALSLAKNMARIPLSAMKAGLKAVTSRLKEFISHSKKTELSAKGLVKTLTSLKTVLVGRIKRMFISSIFSQMKEALNQLATFSGAFNQSVSNIKNNATQLSANLAALMSRLIVAIEPVLTAIISAVSTAMSYLNAFFAMLGGKKTMVVAKKQTASYADSLNDAAGGAKELKRQLMGFDEINRMEKNDSSGSGGAGGSGGDLFEEVPIDSVLPAEVAAYFERLKSAIQNGDWEGVGRIIAEGLNTGMAVVDNWINTVLRPMGVKWSERIARILNGLVDGFDWRLLGKTVADGVNAVVDVINTFFRTVNFVRLGEQFGNGLKSLFENVEWENLGIFITNKLKALLDILHGFLNTFTPTDAATLGDNISKMIQSAISNINFKQAIPDLLQFGAELLITLTHAIEGVNWQQLGKDIAAGVANINWALVAESLFEGIGAVLGGLAGFLKGLLEDAWSGVVGWWKETAFKDGQFTMEGLLKGIWSKICDIGKWIKEHIFEPFINGFKSAFGIHSPSTVMEEMGNFLIEGLFNGISGAWGTITGFFDGALSGLSSLIGGAWERIKGAAQAWGGITSTLSGAWEGIKSTASSIWTNVKDTVSGAFTNTKDSLSNTAQVIGSNLSGAWSSVSSSATGMWDKIKSTVTSKFTGAQTSLSGTAQLMQSTLSQKFSGMLGDATQKFEGIRSALDRASTNSNNVVVRQFSSMASSMIGKMSDAVRSIQNQGWSSVGSGICSGIQSGINRGWSWLSSTVSSLASSLLRSAKNALGIHSPSRLFRDEVGENVGLGWAEGIEGTAGTVLKTVANVAKSITANAEAKMPELQYSGDTLLTGLDTVASKLSGVADIFQNITNMLTALPTLSVPDISVGTVVPYRAKVEDIKSQNEAPTDFSSGMKLLDAISMFQQMFEMVIQAIEDKDTSIVIGDDVIYSSNKRRSEMMAMVRGNT